MLTQIPSVTRLRFWGAVILAVALTLIGGLGLPAPTAYAQAGCQGSPVTVGNDTAYYVQVTYDYPVAGQSTWYYCVESGAAPNISHTTFALSLGCLTLPDGENSAGTWGPLTTDLNPGDGSPAIGTDPTTGLTGLKFDEEIDAGETRNYYFTVDGNYAPDLITVATKAGPGGAFDTALITGPSISCAEEADFGDLPGGAPAPVDYGKTLLANNGARHYFLTGGDVWLGTVRDAENDGQPDPIALGDDFNGSDDEDGAFVVGNWTTGAASLDVVATGAGCVSAWLDWWNGATTYGPDGDFMDAGEAIISNQPVSAGTNNFNFALAPGAVNGQTLYARLRIVPRDNGACTPNTALTLDGSARGGEVEDYAWSWSPTAIHLQATGTAPAGAGPLWLLAGALGLGLASLLALRRRPG